MRPLRTRRSRSVAIGLAAVLGLNLSFLSPVIGQRWQDYQASTAAYKAKYGHWDEIKLPGSMRISAVHAALLQDGKILITAGSGNNAGTFAAGTFSTMLFDPQTRTSTLVHTPTDMFCGGQAFLPDGRLLIAGGTQNYEVLAAVAKTAGGVLTISSTDQAGAGRIIGDHTVFLGSNGRKYYSDTTTSIAPATVKRVGKHASLVVPARATVWAWAVDDGPASTYTGEQPLTFRIQGVDAATSAKLTVTAQRMIRAKHNFEGSAYSYVFDPTTETYLRVSDLTVKRWYPALTGLSDGSVLAVSGLDGVGQLVTAQHTAEQFDVASSQWQARPDLTERFPTYPSLFQTSKPNQLFYTGSNSGYGTDALNRHAPGFWNLHTDAFTPVSGLRYPNMTDSSGSAWLGPVQDQRLVIVGGGIAGETIQSTKRIDTIDLTTPRPAWTPGPDLAHTTRYPLLVNLPDDTLLVTGGSGAYRAENGSSNHDAAILHPGTLQLSKAASPHVSRSYHSEALLLPDGRVLTMGSNPLYSDPANTTKAPFEQRLELYTPPYLYQGARPVIGSAPSYAAIGGRLTVQARQAGDIAKVRLIRPSAVTHLTNLGQRSVAVDFTANANGLALSLPTSSAILPAGYYMLFLIDRQGVPSVARWILIH
ncbi:MAG: galactose oxidase early set domain-containing protein [Actinomycetota bacterium]|nr:galactose oxidase early set domain-containing protein [Actinomycetota bacterium]MDQ2955678.1 galactose oxidase early set domain-containing protein [Actinomycetota bacterium]